MPIPPIAHFGTTLAEPAPDEGVDPASVPFAADLDRTDRFLSLLGMDRFIDNVYPGLGRQFIYRRGNLDDADYFEKDIFTSYSAQCPPPSERPRVADTIFRLTHPDPIPVCRELVTDGLATPAGPSQELEGFLAGVLEAVLVVGPDHQGYELATTRESALDNHAVFVWTDPDRLVETVASYAEQFAIDALPNDELRTFHGIASLTVLQRQTSRVTIRLLAPPEGALAPRWTDDIFKEAGYSHFRLASPNKDRVKAASREVFPDTGNVSFIQFCESYLELVPI